MTTLSLPPGSFAAYLFDCDGTLADTMPLHYRAWRLATVSSGQDFAEDFFYALGGTPTDQVVVHFNERYGTRLPPMETAQRKEQLFLQMLGQVRPIEPVLAVAREGHQRGLPMAVGSGGFRDVVRAILESLGIVDWFGAVVTAEDVTHGKPAPDTYLEAARRLGVDPSRCLVFEDSPPGFAAAAAAGMACVRIPSAPGEELHRPLAAD